MAFKRRCIPPGVVAPRSRTAQYASLVAPSPAGASAFSVHTKLPKQDTRTGSVLIKGGLVVPMTEPGKYYTADLKVEQGRIVALAAHLSSDDATDIIDARDCIVLPGFCQTHVHVVQSLARHHAEGRPLLRWLRERIWPYEAALSPGEVAAAARLGVAELLCGGTTAVLDMGTTHSQDAVFQGAAELGIRMASGKCHMDIGDGVPDGLAEDRDASLAEAERLGERWHHAMGDRLRYAVAPRFVLSCTPELMTGAVTLARQHGYLLHTHSSENPEETRLVREQTGRGNVAYLADLGFFGPDVVLAHCVHVDDQEIAHMAASCTSVVHCPGSNFKLASGIADIPKLLAAGVRVGLGADGPPCNNRLSIFHEMALAGTIHNLRSGAGAIDPWKILDMATRGGADILGWGSEVGRLVPGWRADIVILSTSAWAMHPKADPAAMIVFGGDTSAVRHVLVDGQVVVRDGELLTADRVKVQQDANAACASIAGRLRWS